VQYRGSDNVEDTEMFCVAVLCTGTTNVRLMVIVNFLPVITGSIAQSASI